MELEPNLIPELFVDEIASEGHFGQLSDLLDLSFNVPTESHFYDDFPVWDPKYKVRSVLRLGVFHSQKLVSSASIRIANLRTPVQDPQKSFCLPIGMIGGVVTHPDWRGAGLASSTISLATQWAKERGASLVMLWGSELGLYQKLGFELCGQQARIPLQGLKETRGPVSKGWNPKLFDLIRERSNGLFITGEDRTWYEGHKNVKWYFAGKPEDPLAYAALGRGIDLNGIVHEWGGDPGKLLEILWHIQDAEGPVSLLGSPSQVRKIGFTVPEDKIEYLGMAKVLDPVRLIQAFCPSISAEAQFGEGRWSLSLDGKSYPALADPQLTRLLLGPGPPASVPFLPVPLWIWGLDSA